MAKILSVVVNDILCDGGSLRPQGWMELPRNFGDTGGSQYKITDNKAYKDLNVLIYERPLLTSECILIGRYFKISRISLVSDIKNVEQCPRNEEIKRCGTACQMYCGRAKMVPCTRQGMVNQCECIP
eukprot:UN02189